MKQFIVLFFFIFSLICQAQFQINGVIKDAYTNKALPFASISSQKGFETTSDIDGKFVLETSSELATFEVSYIGYQKKQIAINDIKYFIIGLSLETQNLDEILLTSIPNPATAIIENVILNKTTNNPERKLKSFQFKSYNKLIVTANPDSISGTIDSIFIKKNKMVLFSKIDSSGYKFKKLISSRHLFQTEKVSQFQFYENRLKETVLGLKMSGFKNPVYEIIGFNLQSFSIYDNHYELFETKYNSPIANDALSDYNFKLLDTIEIQNRKTFLIYFKTKKKNKGEGLQGVLFIDQKSYAVAKAIMRLKSVIDVTSTHEFVYLDSEKIWFPINKEFKIVKGNNKEDITILGERFKFDAISDDSLQRKKQSSDFTYLLSKSTHFDLQYNLPIKLKKAAIAIEVKDDATTKSDVFWKLYTKDSLDLRSQKTYIALDSIAKKENVEGKLRFGRKILNGYLPLGSVDIDLRSLLSFNNYEGFRPGIGGITNDRFSKIYRIDGYGAYGTKDGTFKYNLGVAVRVGKFSDTWLGTAYSDDVREIASTSFLIDKRIFKLYDPRPINISTFYNYVGFRAYIETKIIPKTESIWQISQNKIEPKFGYIFNVNGRSFSAYNMTTAMVSLQWNPFSNYMQTPSGRLEIDKQYPKFTFQFTKSLPNILENDFDFGKIDVRADYQKKYLNGQKTALFAQIGYAFGAIPLTHMYNTSPNNLTKDNILQRVTISGKNSFETMFFNEFFSSQYVQFQIKHGSKRVVFFGKIKPSVVFVSRMAFGSLEHPERHLGFAYKTLNEGFFESGIELNQIYKGFGLSGFYRYGPNQLPRFDDNIAIKFNFVLDLGI